MNRGDIYWVKFKQPDKKRPALIITRDWAIPILTSITVIPITTTIRDNASSVWLDQEDGLSEPCIANLDNIQTVSKERLEGFITHLSEHRMREILEAMKFAFGFDK